MKRTGEKKKKKKPWGALSDPALGRSFFRFFLRFEEGDSLSRAQNGGKTEMEAHGGAFAGLRIVIVCVCGFLPSLSLSLFRRV